MKIRYPEISVGYLCGLFGYTRQAWYKSMNTRDHRREKDQNILLKVNEIRSVQGRIGTLKLQYLINKDEASPQIKVGRDYLYKVLRSNNLLVKTPRKNRPKTTDGNGKSLYPDLRKELALERRNQLWSTDITYIRIKDYGFCYATFIVDEWSHKIIGYNVSKTMEAEEVAKALKRAIRLEGPRFDWQLILHSDRGSQYRSKLYLSILESHEIQASMTENGSAYENPVSERLNGIIKNELLGGRAFNSFNQAKEQVKEAVRIYNKNRPHSSCGFLTPEKAHQAKGPFKRLWKRKKAFSGS